MTARGHAALAPRRVTRGRLDAEVTRSGAAAPVRAAGNGGTWSDKVLAEVLVLSYWFEPDPAPAPGPLTIRFSGHRLGTGARNAPGDRFVHDQTVDVAVPGSGPVAVTATVRGVNPGEWEVQASAAGRRDQGRAPRRVRNDPEVRLHRASWSWRRWALAEAPPSPVHTCVAPFARVPAVLPGAWAAMAALGVVVALVTMALADSHIGVDAAPVVPLSLVALLFGAVGAKLWFVVLHRRDQRREGWCVQGLVAGVLVAMAGALLVWSIPVGVFLDVAAPGLFFGLAIGRLGCLLAGCCGGRPTAARWGVWSSDRTVGIRRVPTQLMESAAAVAVGVVALVVVGHTGPLHGGVFAGALAAYTVVRQAILRCRAEPRTTSLGVPLTAAVMGVVLVIDVVLHSGALQRLVA